MMIGFLIKLGVILVVLFSKSVYGFTTTPGGPVVMESMKDKTIIEKLNIISSLVRTLADVALNINKRDIAEKTDNIASDSANTKDKATSIQVSLNNINVNVDYIRQVSVSVDSETSDLKGTMDTISRNIDVIGNTANDFIGRISSIKQNTDEVKSKIDEIGPVVSGSNAYSDLLQRFADSLVAIAELIDSN